MNHVFYFSAFAHTPRMCVHSLVADILSSFLTTCDTLLFNNVLLLLLLRLVCSNLQSLIKRRCGQSVFVKERKLIPLMSLSHKYVQKKSHPSRCPYNNQNANMSHKYVQKMDILCIPLSHFYLYLREISKNI